MLGFSSRMHQSDRQTSWNLNMGEWRESESVMAMITGSGGAGMGEWENGGIGITDLQAPPCTPAEVVWRCAGSSVQQINEQRKLHTCTYMYT